MQYICENCYSESARLIMCCGTTMIDQEVDLLSALEEQGETTFYTTLDEFDD